MKEIYKFLASYEVLIYILLAIAALFAFRWLWRSWQESRVAVYTLEREFSARRLGRSAAVSVLILILFCAEFSVATFVIPGFSADYWQPPTPTLNLLSTPSGTLSPAMMTQYAANPIQTSIANTIGCTPDQIILTAPEAGGEVKGTIDLIGTADVPNFGFYKYEFAPIGVDTWTTISADRKPVKDGLLGRWNTTALTPGDYQLRLVVTDNKGEILPACIVPIHIVPIE